jgi:hypothetical protein
MLPWECRTLRIIKNTSDCRPNQDVTTTLNHELVLLSLIPILWYKALKECAWGRGGVNGLWETVQKIFNLGPGLSEVCNLH